jgi:hypothetical protein
MVDQVLEDSVEARQNDMDRKKMPHLECLKAFQRIEAGSCTTCGDTKSLSPQHAKTHTF